MIDISQYETNEGMVIVIDDSSGGSSNHYLCRWKDETREYTIMSDELKKRLNAEAVKQGKEPIFCSCGASECNSGEHK